MNALIIRGNTVNDAKLNMRMMFNLYGYTAIELLTNSDLKGIKRSVNQLFIFDDCDGNILEF